MQMRLQAILTIARPNLTMKLLSSCLSKRSLPTGIRRQNLVMNDSPPPAPLPEQPRNPLHGVTLEAMVRALEAHYGWEELGHRIPVRCFTHDPSVNSSLKFLRKTPWAREKVEGLYLFMLRDARRSTRRTG
jgi:hypothetical protein